eukprot:5826566-Alexandrium_andersonii.AAC.1
MQSWQTGGTCGEARGAASRDRADRSSRQPRASGGTKARGQEGKGRRSTSTDLGRRPDRTDRSKNEA